MTCETPSRARYQRGVCRCTECTALNTQYQREYETRGRLSQRAESIKARLLAEDPVDWMNDGACRGQLPVFFAEDNSNCGVYDEARRICATCPVIDQCLAYAFRHHIIDGVWGGLSPKQRRDVAKRRRRVPVRPGSRFTIAGPEEEAS